MPTLPVPALTIRLLTLSNIFMTFAWSGHLQLMKVPLAVVILVSGGVALFDDVLQLPATRFGHGTFSATRLKTVQEVIGLLTFTAFSTLSLKEPLCWTHAPGLAFITLGGGPFSTNEADPSLPPHLHRSLSLANRVVHVPRRPPWKSAA